VKEDYPEYSQATRYHCTVPPDDFDGIFQKGDAMIMVLNFETLCKQKLTSTNERYQPVTETGFSLLDLRVIRDGTVSVPRRDTTRAVAGTSSGFFPQEEPSRAGPSLDNPGDRGSNWRPRIRTYHIVTDEYSDHYGANCKATWHKTEPYMFAFGKSQYLKEDDLPAYIHNFWRKARTDNRTMAERKQNKLRDIIFMAWDSKLEEDYLSRVGLSHLLAEDGVRCWDLQLHSYLAHNVGAAGRHDKNAAACCETLGVNTSHKEKSSLALTHNAGNDTAFTLHMMLALANLTDAQKKTFLTFGEKRAIHPVMKANFVGHTLDKVNLPPTKHQASSEDERAAKRLDTGRRPRDAELFSPSQGTFGQPSTVPQSLIGIPVVGIDISWAPSGWINESGTTMRVPRDIVYEALKRLVLQPEGNVTRTTSSTQTELSSRQLWEQDDSGDLMYFD
jgi:hypothetical protein